jgi:hypothetical protein
MDAFFELIDLTSGNVIADFSDVGEALATLRRAAAEHGLSAIENLSLMRIDEDEQSLVAMQDELVDMVETLDRSPTTLRSR